MKNSRMFSFITRTCNPLGGTCIHNCVYCWARGIADRNMMEKYRGQPRIDEKALKQKFKDADFVFICDMVDLFAENVSENMILRILETIKSWPKTKFLLMTKNPHRYLELLMAYFNRHFSFDLFPLNCYLGVTIESNISWDVTKAPSQLHRLYWMTQLAAMELAKNRVFISIEPILDFTSTFETDIYRMKPWAVAIGYDNYKCELLKGYEPPLSKTLQLIEQLEKDGITVYLKTLRERNE